MGDSPRSVRVRFGFVALAAVLLLASAACSSGSDDAGSDTTGAAEETAPAGDTTAPADESAPEGESGSFSLLSYNVAGLPQEISKENPKEHLPLVSPLLNEYDLVLTQEDFDWWKPGGLAENFDFVNYHDRLRADVTHEFRSPVHPGPEAAGIDPADRPEFEIGDGQGLLSRFPLDGYDRRAWTDCFGGFDTSDGGAADCLAIKGFMVATMTLADGALVDVYTLHAEAGGTDEDQRLQAEDFAQLAAFVAEHSEGRAIILGGDTNLHTDLEHEDNGDGADIEIWDEFLTATGLTDSCTETGCTDTGSIDKIAYRNGEGVELVATSWDKPRERFSTPDGVELSDHAPVVVEFEWKSV